MRVIDRPVQRDCCFQSPLLGHGIGLAGGEQSHVERRIGDAEPVIKRPSQRQRLALLPGKDEQRRDSLLSVAQHWLA